MPRLSMAFVLPGVIVLAILTLFAQKAGIWGQPEPGQPPSTATADAQLPASPAAARESVEPPSAGATPPPAAMNPVPAGTPNVQATGQQAPASATQSAPSGEPATRPSGGGG